MAATDSQPAKDIKEAPVRGETNDAATKLTTVTNNTPDALSEARAKFIRGAMPEQISSIYQTAAAEPGNHELSTSAKGHDVSARNAPVDAKSVEDAVDAIRNARGTVLTDNAAISKALDHKSEAELRTIQALYKEKYGTALRDDLKHDFDLPLLGDLLGRGQRAESLLDHRDSVDLAVERNYVNDAAKTKLSGVDYDQFHNQMAKFEERGAKWHLSGDEIARTYREVSKILNTTGDKPLSDDDRKKVAMQIMDNAADPTSISQGSNRTCNVTSVETTLYTKDPSEAARIVADISRTGSYMDRSGIVVESSPETRTNESEIYPNPDGTRNHASEIFQIAAVNLSYRQRGLDITYDQLKIPPPQNATDNGERLYETSQKPSVEVVDEYNNAVRQPKLSINDLLDLHKGITGKNSLEEIHCDAYFYQGHAHGHNIISEQHLNDQLADAKKNGKFPMLVSVNSVINPLWSDSGRGAAGGSGGDHVITVTDYSPGPPSRVNIDNEWEKEADYQGDKMMSTHDLFNIMQPTIFAVQQKQTEIDQGLKDGHFDFEKAIDLLRLEDYDKNQNSDPDFEKQQQDLIDRVITDVQKRGASVPPDEKEQIAAVLTAAGHGLSVEAQLNSITKIYEAKISDIYKFESSVADLGWRIEQEKLKIEKGELPESARAKNEAKSATFQNYIKQLPEDDQQMIRLHLSASELSKWN